ncbi:MAG: 1-propanol dehydrogenase PduQ [Oscillospiraceae bacterium]
MRMETFTLKPKLYFGPDALSALGELAGRRVLVVTDGFLASSGLLDRVRAHLPGSTVTVFDQVTPDPSVELVARGVQLLRECQPDAIVAFGGGSPMDCAKAVRWCSGSAAPLWAIPTTAGTGSEMTAFAVLTDTEKGVKYPLVDDALLPDAAVLDPSLLDGVPPSVTADTGMDVLTHAAEAYVSVGATPFTDALAEKAFVLAYQNLPGAYRISGGSPEKEAMLYASCLAGMAFNAAGLGISHSLAHALGGRIHMPHGRLNAILLPRVMAFNAVQGRAAERYARLARLCGLAGSARALSAALNRLLTALKLPKTLTVDDPKAIAAAALEDRCTATNPRKPSAAELETILRELAT